MPLYYPYSLVPYKGLKLQMSMEQVLTRHEGLVLGRRMSGNKTWMDDMPADVKRFPDDVLSQLVDQIAGLSMNMLTTHSLPHYLRYRQTGSACSSWQGQQADIKKHMGSIYLENDVYVLQFKASSLHNRTFPYQAKLSGQEAYDVALRANAILGNTKRFSKSEEYTLSARVRLLHRPTQMNYWHVELHAEMPCGGDYLKKTKSKSNLQQRTLLANEALSAALDTHSRPAIGLDCHLYVNPRVCPATRMLGDLRRRMLCRLYPLPDCIVKEENEKAAQATAGASAQENQDKAS